MHALSGRTYVVYMKGNSHRSKKLSGSWKIFFFFCNHHHHDPWSPRCSMFQSSHRSLANLSRSIALCYSTYSVLLQKGFGDPPIDRSIGFGFVLRQSRPTRYIMKVQILLKIVPFYFCYKCVYCVE